MRERAMVWGGNVEIKGTPKVGTTVTINIKKDGNGKNERENQSNYSG